MDQVEEQSQEQQEQAPAKSTRVATYREIPLQAMGSNGGGIMLPRNFGEVLELSDVMSRAQHAIPKHLRGVPGACMAVIQRAIRWQMCPFAVATKTYMVNDQIAYEAAIFASVIRALGPIDRDSIEYEYTGSGDRLQCTVSITMLSGVVKEYKSPELGRINPKNSPLWKSDPEQQLGYYSIRNWGRRHTPELLLGVYDPDELRTLRTVSPDGAGKPAVRHNPLLDPDDVVDEKVNDAAPVVKPFLNLADALDFVDNELLTVMTVEALAEFAHSVEPRLADLNDGERETINAVIDERRRMIEENVAAQ